MKNEKINKNFFPPLAAIIFFISILGACKMNDDWSASIVSEIEIAWIEAEEKGGTQEDRESAMNNSIRKHLPLDSSEELAIKLLLKLKENGFEISEYRHENAKIWPDGKIVPYKDDETKKNLQRQIPRNSSKYVATKKYAQENLVVSKYISITILLDNSDHKVRDVRTKIWQKSI